MTTVTGAGAPALLELPEAVDRLLERQGFPALRITRLGKPSQSCRCARPLGLADEWYGAAWVRCLKCGHDVQR